MNREKMMGNAAFVSAKVGTNVAQTITVAAVDTTNKDATIFVQGIQISASAAPTAALRATLTGVTLADGSTLGTMGIQIPAAAFAPLVRDFGNHPLRIKPGTDAVLTVPDPGTLVVVDAQLIYYISGS